MCNIRFLQWIYIIEVKVIRSRSQQRSGSRDADLFTFTSNPPDGDVEENGEGNGDINGDRYYVNTDEN